MENSKENMHFYNLLLAELAIGFPGNKRIIVATSTHSAFTFNCTMRMDNGHILPNKSSDFESLVANSVMFDTKFDHVFMPRVYA